MSTQERWEPETEAEAAAMIRSAAERGIALEIAGGRTKSSIGKPVHAKAMLSTVRLRGITAYRPDEMVLTALAGTSLAEIEAEIDAQGQRLAFEPVDLRPVLQTQGEPTIGSVAAVNNSGPRRIVAGAARDSLVGIRFINGSGETIRSGGRVMKNVTGLDLVKLLAGSWGTLGLLTEVTFKVLPKPETEATLVLRGLDDEEAARALAQGMSSTAELSGAAHLPELVARRLLGPGSATLMRIEGFSESVADRIGRLKLRFDGVAPLERLEADESRSLWRAIANARPYAETPAKPLWRISMTPSRAPAFVMALRMQLAADIYYDWQGGLVWLRPEHDVQPDEVRALLAGHGGGNAMLLRAPPEVRSTVQVFHPVGPGIARLNENVRKALDPYRIFNPGRIDF